MADEGALPAAGGLVPPPGVPSSDGGSGLIHESQVARTPDLIHESQVSASLPDTGLVHESKIQVPGVFNKDAPFTGMPNINTISQTMGATADQAAAIEKTAGIGAGAAGLLMAPLTLPTRAVTGAVIRTASGIGVPGAEELKNETVPKNAGVFKAIFPDVYPSDITNFAIDKVDRATGISEAGSMYHALIVGTKLGLGMGANVMGDPLMLTEFGTLTKAAEEAAKVGMAGADARNFMEIRNPFTGQKTAISMETMKQKFPVITAPSEAIESGWKSATQAFSPDTGDITVDIARSNYDAQKRGAPNYSMGRVADAAQQQLSPEEKALQWKMMESSPNIAPNIHPELIAASKGKLVSGAEEVQAHLEKNLPALAKEAGVNLSEQRSQMMVDQVMKNKQDLASVIEARVNAGAIHKGNIATEVLENYAPRVLSPTGSKAKNAEQLAKQLAKDTNAADKVIKNSWLSSTDPMKYREITRGVSFEEAQAQLRAATGIETPFIDDLTTATQVKVMEAKKLQRDSELLKTVARSGIRPASAFEEGALGRKGWAPIDHPDFNGRMISIQKQDGTVQSVLHRELLFPPQIAEKISDVVRPPAVGALGAWANYANKVFRSTSFMSPMFSMMNAGGNMVKLIARGTTIETMLDTLKYFTGRLSGLQSEANILSKNGRFFPSAELESLIENGGIRTGNALREGIADFANQGKQLTLHQMMSDPRNTTKAFTRTVVDSALKGVHFFGEKGENFTRTALFFQRLKDGYTPGAATREVEKWLFDYNRNSPLTNKFRFFFPFFQHAVKTGIILPELVAGAPGEMNQMISAFPHVVANAFHDPVTQEALRMAVPDYLQVQDAVFGPILPGNSFLGSFFTNPNTPSKSGTAIYFKPGRIGLDVINVLNPLAPNNWGNSFGLAPFWKGFVGAFVGKDMSKIGQGIKSDLDKATPGGADISSRVGYFIQEGILGSVNMPATMKMIYTAFGIDDNYKYIDPAVMRAINASASTFGGFTNLDKDFLFRMFAFAQAEKQLAPQLMAAVRAQHELEPGSFAMKMRSLYGEILPTLPVRLYQEMKQKELERDSNYAAEQFLQGKITPADLASRIKAARESNTQAKQAYLLGNQRFLQMGAGAKSPAEARSKAGVDSQ